MQLKIPYDLSKIQKRDYCANYSLKTVSFWLVTKSYYIKNYRYFIYKGVGNEVYRSRHLTRNALKYSGDKNISSDPTSSLLYFVRRTFMI